ncbi:MAG: MFS transporter [Ignavibacteria bacterium]
MILPPALKSRNYVLFYLGQGISVIGTWLQMTAISWLVYRLTNSPVILAFVSIANHIPSLLLSPIAGVVADKYPRKIMLFLSESCLMLAAFVLYLLVITNNASIPLILLVSSFCGIINAFEMTFRWTFLGDITASKKDVPNAIALNSTLFNGARLIGPSVAGAIIYKSGEASCFLLNGLSYIAILIALFFIKPDKLFVKIENRQNIFHSLKEGIIYVRNHKIISALLGNLVLVSLFGSSYAMLMPVFAKEMYHGNSKTYGLMMSAVGFGTFVAAVYLALRRKIYGLENIITIGVVFISSGLIIFPIIHEFNLSLVVLFIIGLGTMFTITSSNTLIQTLADDDKRGRVMGLYSVALAGLIPVGNLIAGAMAGKIGASMTIIVSGVACISCIFLTVTKIVPDKLKFSG